VSAFNLTVSASTLAGELEDSGGTLSSKLQGQLENISSSQQAVTMQLSNIYFQNLQNVLTTTNSSAPGQAENYFNGGVSTMGGNFTRNAPAETWLNAMYDGWDPGSQTAPLTDPYGQWSSYYVTLEMDGLNGEEKRSSSITDPTGSINQS
jgi:hypothetical protein